MGRGDFGMMKVADRLAIHFLPSNEPGKGLELKNVAVEVHYSAAEDPQLSNSELGSVALPEELVPYAEALWNWVLVKTLEAKGCETPAEVQAQTEGWDLLGRSI